ncbi:MAG: PAS domain S-box protein [Balneolia bacterium]|nr:PAS domain S-box protein [Balneolia bacterium]
MTTSGDIVICDQLQSADYFVRRKEADDSGIKSVFAMPLSANNENIGALMIGSAKFFGQDNSRTDYLTLLGNIIGGEIVRKHQEEEMQQLFEHAPEILGVASPSGYFHKVNPAFCKALGYTKEELISRPFKELLHPEDLEKTLREFDETKNATRYAKNFLNRYKTKDGEYRWISWDSSDVINEEGAVFAFGRDVTELVKLEQVANNANQLSRIGAWDINIKTNLVYFSEMTSKIFGLEPGKSPHVDEALSFYPPDVQKQLILCIEKCRIEGIPWDLELQMKDSKGKPGWVRSIGRSEFVNGECVRLFGSVQDITDRKLSEVQLTQTLKEKNTLLESIGESFFSIDRNWTVLYWNKRAEELMGISRDEILGKNIWEIYPDAKAMKYYKEYVQAFETGEPAEFTEQFNTGERNAWLQVNAYPADGNMSIFIRDITEKKIGEEKLRLSNERFKRVTEATNDAIWDYDAEKNELFWGKGFNVLFGYDDSIKPALELVISKVHPDDRQRIFQKISDYMAPGTVTNWFEEYRFQKGDGTYALVIDRAVFIRNENGHVIRVVGAMTDISYRKEYEESLKKLNSELKRQAHELTISNRELEQFAYIASHDLQEPLRMVTSFLTLLKKRYGHLFDDKAHQYIHFAVDGSKRMREIILDLLEYSRVGKHEDKVEQIEVSEIIEEVRLLQKRVIDSKNAEIITHNLPVLSSYRTPLTLVFHNLVENALKYSRKDRTPIIEIRAREETSDWIFTITDNGIGIEEQHFDKIFIIFQRLHSKEEYPGTGMGLAVVKKTLESLGGEIWVESVADKGSAFHISLPKEIKH